MAIYLRALLYGSSRVSCAVEYPKTSRVMGRRQGGFFVDVAWAELTIVSKRTLRAQQARMDLQMPS